MEQFKQNLAFWFEDTGTLPGKAVDIFLLIINTAACVLFFHDIAYDSALILPVYTVLDDVIVGIFIIEYILRFWVAAGKRKFVFSLMSILDLLVIIPSVFAVGDFRFLRIFRVFRIFRFARFFKNRVFFFGKIKKTHLYAARIIFTLFSLIFVTSGMIFAIEKQAGSDSFSSIYDAFYFSIVTLTTVGFGDIVPVSPYGRLVTVFAILFGISLIPYQVGVLIKTILSGEKLHVTCPGCGLERHDVDAVHCKHCGTVIFHKH